MSLILMSITGKTSVFGIVGNPISHSLSPLLHNFAFKEFGVDAIYVPFLYEINQKKDEKLLKNLLINFNVKGLSVTIPYKFLAFKTADYKDNLSAFTKSSNTLINQNQKIYAYNTDGKGALDALYDKTTLKDKNVLIVGYGGSSSAIVGAILLNDQPKNIIISGRNKQKGQKFVRDLNKNISHRSHCFYVELEKLSNSKSDITIDVVDIIINTTPIGMKGNYENQSPLPEQYIQKKHIVMDIIYNPQETQLIKIAKAKKATIIEGYWMFLYQAAYQMELFLNKKIEKEFIKKLKKLLLKTLK